MLTFYILTPCTVYIYRRNFICIFKKDAAAAVERKSGLWLSHGSYIYMDDEEKKARNKLTGYRNKE